MKKTLVIAGAAIILGSCAEAPITPQMTMTGVPLCTAQLCKIEVIVGAGCYIIQPETWRISHGRHVIQWSLSQDTMNRYSFAPKGIDFAPGGPFSGSQAGPRVFTWVDDNSGDSVNGLQKVFKYSVRILDGGMECGMLDPYVINDP